MMLLGALLAACGLLSSSDPEVPPQPVPAPEPTFEYTYVHASMLRLRENPSPDAAWSPLAIGTRARVLGREGEWVRIIAPDGRTGYVRADFVGQMPLTIGEVRSQIARAADPAGR